VVLIIYKEDTGGLHYGDVFLLWVASIALLAIALVWRRVFTFRQFLRDHRSELWILTALTGVAAALRLTTLGQLPSVIDGDEGLIGMAGLSVGIEAFNSPFGTFHGLGTLYIHLLAGLMDVFGANTFGLRVAAAIGGTLAVPAVYLLGRELVGHRAGLFAGVLIAVSHFHLHFSRVISVTYVQGTFFNTLALYLLISGLRRESAARLALSGMVMGVYFMIYLDARMMIGVIVLVIAALAILERALIVRNVRRLLLPVLTLVIVAAPMLLWATRHAADFNARFAAAGAFETGLLAQRMAETGESALQVIADVAATTFMTLIAVPVQDFYFTTLSVLSVVSSILFVFGLVYSIVHWRRVPMLILNLWLWTGVAGISIFTLDEASAGYRLLFVLPAVCVLAGLGLDKLLDALQLPARTTAVAGAGVMLVAVVVNLNTYFSGYLTSCHFGGDPATRLSARLGQHLRALDPVAQAYLLTDGRVIAGTHPSLDFLSGRIPVTNVDGPLTDESEFDVSRPTAFVTVESRIPDLGELAHRYPGGTWSRALDCNLVVFVSYRVTQVGSN
jgi:hypothetical protein